MATFKNTKNQPLSIDLGDGKPLSVAGRGKFHVPPHLVGHRELERLKGLKLVRQLKDEPPPAKEAPKPAAKPVSEVVMTADPPPPPMDSPGTTDATEDSPADTQEPSEKKEAGDASPPEFLPGTGKSSRKRKKKSS